MVYINCVLEYFAEFLSIDCKFLIRKKKRYWCQSERKLIIFQMIVRNLLSHCPMRFRYWELVFPSSLILHYVHRLSETPSKRRYLLREDKKNTQMKGSSQQHYQMRNQTKNKKWKAKKCRLNAILLPYSRLGSAGAQLLILFIREIKW